MKVPGAPGWLLAALLAAGAAQAGDGDARTEADKASYNATCAFLEGEVQRLEAIAGKRASRDKLVREDPASGARLYRHQGKDVRIEYLVLSDGKLIISRAELGPNHLGAKLTASSLKNTLLLAQDIPATWQTGCDGLDLTVKRKGKRIVAMTIEAYVD